MDVETDLPARRVNGRVWTPGQSGNPASRPIGARGRRLMSYAPNEIDQFHLAAGYVDHIDWLFRSHGSERAT